MGLVLELNFKTDLNCFLSFAFLDEDVLDIYLGESRKLNNLINVWTRYMDKIDIHGSILVLILLTFSLLKTLIEHKWCRAK